ISLMVKPTDEVRVEEPVVAQAKFAVEEEEEDQLSRYSECTVHDGTLSEENADPTQATQL
ncbi:hypothetical protein KI387_036038, partial [Taxus chinensis]